MHQCPAGGCGKGSSLHALCLSLGFYPQSKGPGDLLVALAQGSLYPWYPEPYFPPLPLESLLFRFRLSCQYKRKWRSVKRLFWELIPKLIKIRTLGCRSSEGRAPLYLCPLYLWLKLGRAGSFSRSTISSCWTLGKFQNPFEPQLPSQ